MSAKNTNTTANQTACGSKLNNSMDDEGAKNSYEERQRNRKERLEAKAPSAAADSNRFYQKARGMADCIPFGQPILIGHHSEGRDRRFRARIHGTLGKAVQMQKKAEHYEQMAASVGTGGISSDDPDAVVKLRAELVELEANQERMKAANVLVRKKDVDGLVALLKVDEDAARKLLAGDFAGRTGFPSYMLSNNNANIRRIRQRIADLEKKALRADVVEDCGAYTYREDVAENRIMFEFTGKPAANIRDILKASAFKWSPSRGAWVRMLSPSGLYAAKRVKEQLDQLGGR